MKWNFKTWELTTEHAGSNGQPVLVSQENGEVFGAADIMRVEPTWTFMPAADAVRRMARTVKLTDEQRELVERFVGMPKV